MESSRAMASGGVMEAEAAAEVRVCIWWGLHESLKFVVLLLPEQSSGAQPPCCGILGP